MQSPRHSERNILCLVLWEKKKTDRLCLCQRSKAVQDRVPVLDLAYCEEVRVLCQRHWTAIPIIWWHDPKRGHRTPRGFCRRLNLQYHCWSLLIQFLLCAYVSFTLHAHYVFSWISIKQVQQELVNYDNESFEWPLAFQSPHWELVLGLICSHFPLFYTLCEPWPSQYSWSLIRSTDIVGGHSDQSTPFPQQKWKPNLNTDLKYRPRFVTSNFSIGSSDWEPLCNSVGVLINTWTHTQYKKRLTQNCSRCFQSNMTDAAAAAAA